MGRLRPFDLVAGVGGVVLLVSLWLTWYGVRKLAATGWQAFTVTDILLAAIALLAIAVTVVAATARGPAIPVAIVVLATVASAFAVLLIAYRMLNEPGPNDLVELRFGAWVGLAGALIACAGSFLALKDESTPGAVPPDVPRRPAPPAS